MSDVVETRVNNHIFDVSVKPNRNAQAQEQEVKDCTEFLKIEYTKFRKYKILLDCIEECIEDDNNLDSELRTKIKKIILGEQVSQTRLSDNPIEDTFETILGVPLSSTELTFSESNNLHSCLKSKLDSKSASFKSECFRDVTDTSEISSESPLDLAQNDATLLDYRNQLVTEQETYMKNQIDMLDLLEELKDIRLKTVPEVTDKKYEECNFRSRINHLKSQLASNKCRIDIFMETSDSLKAYTEILKDLKEQQEELAMEIERLKHLKKKHSEVSCKEYDDILKSYLQYKSALAKKKLRFELCE